MTEHSAVSPEPAQSTSPPAPSSSSMLPKAPLGTPEWEAEWKAIEAARESSKVYQLAFWPDDKRAMPADFIACALFSCLQGKDSDYVERQTLASINGLSVTFTGRRLTQVHADVWEAIMHLSRQLPEGSHVRFSARQLLRLMGRQTGGKQRDDLDLWINQLTATSVVIHDEKNHQRFRGSLLPRSAEKTGEDDTLYSVDINRDLAKVLSANLFLVDWEKRRQLQQKPLAAWLQRHFSRFQKPIAVAELYRLSGSTTKRLVDFRKLLRAALSDLQTVGVLASSRIDEPTDTVHVTLGERRVMGGTTTPAVAASSPRENARVAPGQASLPLALGPSVGADARATFRSLYPGKDVDRCLADFTAWLARKGSTADRPDAAFLGFARKWTASS
jgi:TrfA protein